MFDFTPSGLKLPIFILLINHMRPRAPRQADCQLRTTEPGFFGFAFRPPCRLRKMPVNSFTPSWVLGKENRHQPATPLHDKRRA